MTRRGYTDDQLAFIRASVATLTDVEIAKALGWKPGKVLHTRQLNDIAAKPRETFWSDDKTNLAKELYLVEGLPAVEVGERIGCDGAMIRRKAKRMGWVRDPAARVRNQFRAQRRIVERKRVAPPKPRVVIDTADDNILIADFLARRAPTVLPPGVAAGLSKMEAVFWTVGAGGSWKDAQQSGLRAAAKKRAAA